MRSVRSSLEHRSTFRTSIFSSLFNGRFLLHFYTQSIKMPERSHLISRHSFSYITFPAFPHQTNEIPAAKKKKTFPFLFFFSIFVAKNNNNSMWCHSNRIENNKMRFDGVVCASPLALSHSLDGIGSPYLWPVFIFISSKFLCAFGNGMSDCFHFLSKSNAQDAQTQSEVECAVDSGCIIRNELKCCRCCHSMRWSRHCHERWNVCMHTIAP